MAQVQTSAPFTAFGTDGPDTSAFNSMLASLNDGFNDTRTAGASTVAAATTTASVSAVTTASSKMSASSVASATSSPKPSTTAATTLSTVPSSSISSSGIQSTTIGAATATSLETMPSTTTTTQNPAGANVGGQAQQQSCNSISCSAGLKAAVAVPVVVGVLAIVAFVAFLMRRRKRKSVGKAQGIGEPEISKKWTRHLRMFSFDAELLMGGRFSSNNSLRSGRSSVRDPAQSPNPRHSGQPSLRSIDEVAPPYRAAVSHAQSLSMTQVGPGMLVTGGLAGSAPRPVSSATAPPPYVSASRQSDRPITGASSRSNPFTDSIPASPVEDSPFNDPLDGDQRSNHTQSSVSRNSSLKHDEGADDTSTLASSEAASIHEARVGRHVSVNSMGRAISNVRLSQQRVTTPL